MHIFYLKRMNVNIATNNITALLNKYVNVSILFKGLDKLSILPIATKSLIFELASRLLNARSQTGLAINNENIIQINSLIYFSAG